MIAASEGTLIIAASHTGSSGTMEVSVTAAAYIVVMALPIVTYVGGPEP